jgi:hypothetical protein
VSWVDHFGFDLGLGCGWCLPNAFLTTLFAGSHPDGHRKARPLGIVARWLF